MASFSNSKAAAKPIPTSIVTSGGVSKGAYQAGFLYYLNSYHKLNTQDSQRPRIFTGTSAGGINSYLSLLDSCSIKQESVMESTFFQFWEKGGLETLYDPKKVTHNRIFSFPPDSEAMQLLKKKWFAGIKQGCKAYLGLTLTHLNSKEYRLSDELVTSQMKETIVLEIVGRGLGKAPSISVKKVDQIQNFVIDFAGTDEQKYHQFEKLLYATSAFPVAFEPVYLKYCYQTLNEASCSKYSEDFFVDGGVFNNTPIRLAYKISGLSGRQDFSSIIVDSDHHIYHASEKEKTYKLDEIKIQDLTSGLFFNFLDASQKNDVAEFAREYADSRVKIYSAVTNLPTASEPLAHFWGLFDSGFRSFDFLLGMNDAQTFLKNKFSESTKLTKLELLFDEGTHQKLQCLRNFEACGKISDKNFLILLQTSIYKIYDMCAGNTNDKVVVLSPYCLNAKGATMAPSVTGVSLEDWKIHENESELEYTLRLLQAQNYHFSYLSNSATLEGLSGEVRAKLRGMLSLLIEKQQVEQLSFLKLMRKNLFDYVLYYEPMTNFWFLNIGKMIEVGYRSRPDFASSISK